MLLLLLWKMVYYFIKVETMCLLAKKAEMEKQREKKQALLKFIKAGFEPKIKLINSFSSPSFNSFSLYLREGESHCERGLAKH